MKKCYQTNYPKKEYFKEISFKNLNLDNIDSTIYIKKNKPLQQIVGFGGAFTEAASYVFHQASDEVKEKILKMYFSDEGLGYELGRMSIHSCDFALENYTYIEENDHTLKTFSIEREHKYLLPMLKEAMKYSPNLKMAVAPWSPPAFMKSNNQMNRGGKLLKSYYDLYSEYIIKYLLVMKEEGIDIEYLSLQNEPEANQTWDSCIYEPKEMLELVKVIHPKLVRNNLNPKILILDHNRDILEKWAKAAQNDKEALNLIWGLAIHWYVSEDFDALRRAKLIAPSLNILFTEGCIEGGPRPFALHTGERYIRNMIGDLNNGCSGYIEWNLLLDEQGGPNHKNNYCDAPMLLSNDGHLIVNSSYYYIGHIAKYIKNGSYVLEHINEENKLQVLTAINQNNQLVVVICNPHDIDLTYQITYLQEDIQGHIFAHTIQTWVIDNE